MTQNKDYVVVNIPTSYSLPSSPTYNFTSISPILSTSTNKPPSPNLNPNNLNPSNYYSLPSSPTYNLEFPIQSHTNLAYRRRINNRHLYATQTQIDRKDNSDIEKKNINNDCFINIGNVENINFQDENSNSKYKNQSKISKCSNIIRNIIGIQKTSNIDTEYMNV